MQTYVENVASGLSKALSDSISSEARVAVLFSGGLDSSLLAFLAKEHAQTTLYTAGTKDSHDLEHAKQASEMLDLDLKCIEITDEDIISGIPLLSKIAKIYHPVKISFELPLFLAMKDIEEDIILSGQGADELFGGYARYLTMEKANLKTALEKDLSQLISQEIHTDFIIALHFNKSLKIPYLHETVVNYAKKIPISYKVNEGQRKIVLKEAAIKLGLPPDIANKEKKAVQYSSGIIKELRKIAKRQDMGVNELIQHLLDR
jgi:asparagine synthase (glutamine-hydrolysing)